MTGAYVILSEAALLHHRVIIGLFILCTYVDSIPHSNYIHCTNWRERYLLQLVCERGGGVWWEGEKCRSGEGMWDNAGNGTVEWHV